MNFFQKGHVPEFVGLALAKCLTPKETKGRVYAMTETGKLLVKAAFNIDIPKAPSGISWKTFSDAARGEVRSMILLELNRLRKFGRPGETKAGIKKAILITHGPAKAASPSSVRRAVEDLIEMELVKCVGVAENRMFKH